jgi:hypothetical protein
MTINWLIFKAVRPALAITTKVPHHFYAAREKPKVARSSPPFDLYTARRPGRVEIMW